MGSNRIDPRAMGLVREVGKGDMEQDDGQARFVQDRKHGYHIVFE